MPRQLGVGRRATQIVDITDEFANNIKETPNVVIWYDKEEPRLCVYRSPISKLLIWRVAITREEVRILQAVGEKKSNTAYIVMEGVRTVDQARARLADIRSNLNMAAEKANTMKATVERSLHAAPEDILRDRPPEEQAHYESLMGVLMDAYAQAVNGKGAERHEGGDVSFDKQDMMQIMDRVGVSFSLGQAIKKVVESQRLIKEQAREELLGAIVYLAGAVVWKDKR